MNFKTIFKSLKNKDMRKRIFAVVGILVVYRFLAHVPVPIGDHSTFKSAIESLITNTDFGGFINLISGGGLTSLSIILVGLSPYITSSIVMQLLSKAIPSLEEISKDGEVGRRKINQWTRILTIPLAILQSIAYVYILSNEIVAANIAADVSLAPKEWAIAALIRAVLCLFPQNGWLENSSGVTWGIIRNVPFVFLGAAVCLLYWKNRGKDRTFRFIWLYILLSLPSDGSCGSHIRAEEACGHVLRQR